ncbi:MAG: hypothetical protein JXC85_05010 [Candidatus Aenigmarchaeota archaeon]|nr:hypothetical protein [Candidatus Aenigmarchaeota archaeon]
MPSESNHTQTGKAKKGQSTVYVFSVIFSLITAVLAVLITHFIPIIIIASFLCSIFFAVRSRYNRGQAELAISVILMLLAAGSVVAYSALNSTMNASFTGNFLATGDNNTQDGTPSVKIIEKTKTIEIWANTFLDVEVDPKNNVTIARLQLDNGTSLPGQMIHLYLNGEILASEDTDADGEMVIYTVFGNGTNVVRAEFLGNDDEYLNRSWKEAEIIIGVPEENVTQNATEPEIRIQKIVAPSVINQTEEFEVHVYVTSLFGASTGVDVRLESPSGLEILEEYLCKEACPQTRSEDECDFGSQESQCSSQSVCEKEFIKSIPEIDENETIALAWRVKAVSVGNYSLTVYAESEERSRDNRTFDMEVLYLMPSGITYDPVTDTIHVLADGKTCTDQNPCGFFDIHYVDQLMGWGNVGKIRNYFTLDANLVIGDGDKETWLNSESETLNFNGHVVVLGKGHLSFGHSIGGFTSRGALIQTDVPDDFQLIGNSAFMIGAGGTLELYGSSYKVFHETAENSIYCEDGSHIFIERFTLQRAKGDGEVILYVPQDAEIKDLLVVNGGRYMRRNATGAVLESRMVGYVE